MNDGYGYKSPEEWQTFHRLAGSRIAAEALATEFERWAAATYINASTLRKRRGRDDLNLVAATFEDAATMARDFARESEGMQWQGDPPNGHTWPSQPLTAPTVDPQTPEDEKPSDGQVNPFTSDAPATDDFPCCRCQGA